MPFVAYISQVFSLNNSKINKLKGSSVLEKPPTWNFAPNSVPEPPTISSTTKYLEDDLQYIFKIVLEIKNSALFIALINDPHK